MRHVGDRVLGGVLLLLLASWAPVVGAAAPPLEIRHQPLACVPADRFVHFVAQGAPPAGVRSAELQFRADAQGGWYSIAMRAEGGQWSAVLPRATRALAGFEYRISLAGPGLQESRSPTYAVDVSADASACGSAAAQLSVSSSIVVRVPPRAPVVPPVPAGFDPAGVVAAQEREPPKSKKAVALLGGLAAAGLVAGAAASGSSNAPQDPLELPTFAFNGTSPNPDSTISLSRGRIQVFVRMSREPEHPLDFTWRVGWRQSESGPICVMMGDLFYGAQSPPDLLLSAPLVPSGFCGERFETPFAHITIQASSQTVLDVTLALPFRFEP